MPWSRAHNQKLIPHRGHSVSFPLSTPLSPVQYVSFLWYFSGSAGKEATCSVGRSPGEGKGYPRLQYSGLENSMHCIVHGVTKVGHDWSIFTYRYIFFLSACIRMTPLCKCSAPCTFLLNVFWRSSTSTQKDSSCVCMCVCVCIVFLGCITVHSNSPHW